MSNDQTQNSDSHPHNETGHMTKLIVGAIGVVFGDIGTSPLYAMRVAFAGGALPVTEPAVLGVLSLIFWSLLLVVTLKYVLLMMNADNRGEEER